MSLLFLLLHIAVVWAHGTSRSTYLSFALRDACGVALHEVIPSTADPTDDILKMEALPTHFADLEVPVHSHIVHPVQHERKYLLTFHRAGALWGQAFSDPRLYVSTRAMEGEPHFATHGHLEPELHVLDEASHIVYIPPDVASITMWGGVSLV